MVNVRIIENVQEDPERLEVIRLYREGLSMKTIGKMFGGSESWARRILHEAKDNGELEIRPSSGVNPKNYCYNKNSGRYNVYKQFNGKNYSFGTYSDETTAKKVVDELRKVNWDKDCLKDIKKDLGIE